MSITSYTLAKNNEDCIEKAFLSVAGVDEIVLVDTGSTDKTKEIASKFTDKIYDFPWVDDFSLARNFALSKCASDWILVLDSDFELEAGGVDKIKELISTTTVDVINLWFLGKTHKQPLLFKNSPKHYYKGSVHEYLSVVGQLEAEIYMKSGWSDYHKQDPDRDRRILQFALDKDPSLVRERFYYARDFYYRKEYYKAIIWCDKYLEVGTWLAEIAEAFYLKAMCLWQISRGEEARNSCLRAIGINANMKKAHLLMAEMSWEHNAICWKQFAEIANNKDVVFA